MSLVIVEREGPVRSVALGRPQKRDASDDERLGRLHDAFTEPPAGDERIAGPVCWAMDPARCRSASVRPASVLAGS